MRDAPEEFFFYTEPRLRWETKMQVLLADDRPKTRFALRLLLERQPGIQVVGEAADAEALLVQARVTSPNVVLLDWELPKLAATGSLPLALRRACPHLYVIALSGRPEMRVAALAAGADAFVSKADPPESLLAAVRSAGTDKEDG
jgi:DNA-binding NarL/FixJ family response regulator